MTTTYFNEFRNFQTNYRKLALSMDEKDVKSKLPEYSKVNEKVNSANKQAMESLKKWSESTPASMVWLKKKALWLSKYLPIKGILKRCGITEEKLSPRKSAESKFNFDDIANTDKLKLEKKSKIYSTLSKVALIVGAIFVIVGVLLPLFASVPLLMMPPTAAIVSIVALTVLGIGGVGLIISSLLLKNTRTIRENRLHSDPDFKLFLNHFVQQKEPTGIGYNLNKTDLTDKKLHQIFQSWQKEMKSAFSKSTLEKLAKEGSTPKAA